MNPLIIRLCCKWAALGGEPACACDRPDEFVAVAAGDRRTWWTMRMRQRDPRELSEMRAAVGDRVRVYGSIKLHAERSGRTFRAHRLVRA